MDDVKERLILAKLKNIQNVATLMKDYFKPFDQFVEDKKYTTNEAINAKGSTHKYLDKYGAFMLDTTVRNIENIINGIEIQKSVNKIRMIQVNKPRWKDKEWTFNIIPYFSITKISNLVIAINIGWLFWGITISNDF